MCAFLYLLCLSLLLIPSSWNILSNLTWNGFKVCQVGWAKLMLWEVFYVDQMLYNVFSQSFLIFQKFASKLSCSFDLLRISGPYFSHVPNPEYRKHYKHFQKSHRESWLGSYSGSQHIFLLHTPEAAGSCPSSQEGQLALREKLGKIKRRYAPHYLPKTFFHLSHPFSQIMRKTACKYTLMIQD